MNFHTVDDVLLCDTSSYRTYRIVSLAFSFTCRFLNRNPT